MNHPPFARGVAALEYDYDFGAVRPYPFLHFDELGLEFAQLPLVFFLSHSSLPSDLAILVFVRHTPSSLSLAIC
jgi:hypothetical protein